ncbi:hypothetical protein GH714_022645 [Hevea brasiliensis]|uniref:TATA-box-binding protein n=1 Tax=Hevea brasiliensis TaxID=3981 RepID=A0A6A6LZT5_HEVBR|nr:hypothetical protein GH714_022645 [Hevea brasiliensis]
MRRVETLAIKLPPLLEISRKGVRAGTKAAAITCVVTAIPTGEIEVSSCENIVKGGIVEVVRNKRVENGRARRLGREQPVDLSKHPSGIVPTLQNIVSTVNLDCKLDLKQIALQARNAEYNPKRFAAVIMRIREPKTTALIFASGKMVCTGAKSEQQSKLAARKVYVGVELLLIGLDFGIVQSDMKLSFSMLELSKSLGFLPSLRISIQNIVGSCDVKFPIRLEGLAYSHGAFSSYEPELFPGLIYRMKQPKIVLLIFVSGKIVITGAKVRDETYTAFENIYPVLTEFRKIYICVGGMSAAVDGYG